MELEDPGNSHQHHPGPIYVSSNGASVHHKRRSMRGKLKVKC